MNSDNERIKFIFSDKYIVVLGFQQEDNLEGFEIYIYKCSENRFIFRKASIFYSKGFNSFQLNSQKAQVSKKYRVFGKKDKNQIEIIVKFIEEGA
ncbi:unnamed protein product [Paramecium octaurelia]|uniref:Uncharacterized protein n=1 Tax=Paramecium octaurelia TaxID=43137 RepID=A0A8S1X0F7_PAROT|nr:unnamed protein product [Paramecium octaurelia]